MVELEVGEAMLVGEALQLVAAEEMVREVGEEVLIALA